MEEALSALTSQLFGVWFLIGAALVFWMQAGFAMVETGFTRAKNAGNIIMKNLMHLQMSFLQKLNFLKQLMKRQKTQVTQWLLHAVM